MLVYFHRNPKTYQIFYVGVGSRKSRAYDFSTGRNPYFKNYLTKNGIPIVQIVHDRLTKEQAHYLEKFYIKLFGRKKEGGPLVNISEGGDATPILPAESRKRATEALVAWVKNNPDKNPTFKPEHSIRMRENNPMHNLEYVQKIRVANTGKKASLETRIKQSELKKGKPSNQPKGYKHSPEVINRLKEINKEIANRPDIRAKLDIKKKGFRNTKNSLAVNMLTHNHEIIKTFPSIVDALIELGKPRTSGDISSVCKGKRNFAFGYKWQYAS